MAIQEACQVYIEQEIHHRLSEGKSYSKIGKEISKEIKRLFDAVVSPGTIKKRASRTAKKGGTNVPSSENNNLEETYSEESQEEPTASPAPTPDPPQKPYVSVFNETNENIDWARWSWNPVTGCLHDCKYCYARDIANRFFKEKFKPTFHPKRLDAPKNTALPDNLNGRDRNVFVCSMADLFGTWVKDAWIDRTIEAVRNSPEWNFIFLTKNPERMIGIDWPNNAKVGATVDVQDRVERTEVAFRKIKAPVKFLSCEPLLSDLVFEDLSIFDCIIIGAQSRSTQCPEFQPKREWVVNILLQAEDAQVKRIFLKPNLTVFKDVP